MAQMSHVKAINILVTECVIHFYMPFMYDYMTLINYAVQKDLSSIMVQTYVEFLISHAISYHLQLLDKCLCVMYNSLCNGETFKILIV